IAHAGLGVVNWYKAGGVGEMPTGVLVIAAFIVFAPFLGAIVSYSISIWLLHSAKKSIWPKLFTLAVMLATGLLVYYQMHSYDTIKHPRFESEFYSVIFESHNIKWFLVGIIIWIICIFNLIFSSLNQTQSTAWLKKMQLVSSASFSLGHGGNDSQKVMGIIAAAVIVYIHTSGHNLASLPEWLQVELPYKDANGEDVAGNMPAWIPLACYSAIAIGTLSGGWKIVKTMGSKITKVTPFEGVTSETAGALTLYFT